MTDIRFAFETLRHDHDAKTFGLATEGPPLTGQDYAEECDIHVLMAYGRCLRPALYSSLRSSPSHPTGVSALRVTIAIANFASLANSGGLRKSTAKSRRLFRNESATSRRVRAGAIGGSTAMGRTACCRKSPRVPRVSWFGSWALGASDRGGQDKSRKVRSVGCVRNSAKSGLLANIASASCNLGFSRTRYRRSTFNTLQRIYER